MFICSINKPLGEQKVHVASREMGAAPSKDIVWCLERVLESGTATSW